MALKPLQTERIVVCTGRLICDVVIPDVRQRYTTAPLARQASIVLPNLSRHTCVNDKGTTFSAVMASTSVPHLLEHMAIDIQTNEDANEDALFVGTTIWTDERQGKARIELSFKNDLAALRAYNKAVELLNRLLLDSNNAVNPKTVLIK